MRQSISLHQAKCGAVRRGHPWIFPKAINKFSGKFQTGELIDVYDNDNQLLGVGVFNEHSLYRVRLLAQAFEVTPDTSFESLVSMRLKQALAIRQVLDLPNDMTTAFRLFNSEADGLSGLTIDCFNKTCVVASSAYWVEAQKAIIGKCIQDITGCDDIIWLAQSKPLSQDGWKQSEIVEPPVITTEVMEAGVRYQVNFAHAQKTGLFLDQRENHQRIAQLAKGKRVLDLYSYTGGFALHAAMAGASKVTAVDSSSQAIEQARQNAVINGLGEAIEFVEADARDYLVQAGDYDLIILDPPKLVPSQQHLERAKNYYRFLHREIFKAMKPGSILMTCNCSSALSPIDFSNLVSAQATMVKKQARILGVFGPASCHPTLSAFPEGNYLTAVLLAVV